MHEYIVCMALVLLPSLTIATNEQGGDSFVSSIPLCRNLYPRCLVGLGSSYPRVMHLPLANMLPRLGLLQDPAGSLSQDNISHSLIAQLPGGELWCFQRPHSCSQNGAGMAIAAL